jgi:enoyl-CoA hydratase/carnithine racemase
MSYVSVEFWGNYAKVIMDTGGKYNVINKQLMYSMIDTFRKLDNEKSIRFVILTGANKNFGAGADIKELKLANENREYAMSFFSTMSEMYRTLLNFSKPVISVVEGVAYGASMELLLVSDIVISSPYSRFAAPGGKIGVLPPVLLTLGKEILGWDTVKKLALLGEELSADEAKEVGLVHYISENLEEEGRKVIEKLKQMAPTSLTNMRKILYSKYEKELQEAFKILIDQVGSRDATNGVLAFLSKTKPPWAN